MDFLLELVASLFVQVFSELIGRWLLSIAGEGAGRLMDSRQGRYVLTCLFGLAVGAVWGWDWREQPQQPRLLVVSLVFAGLALALRVALPPGRQPTGELTWGWLFAPPWRWSDERLTGLVWLNLALAAGVALGYATR